MPLQCICGTELPDEGTDFEPQCRFCDRLMVERLIQENSDSE